MTWERQYLDLLTRIILDGVRRTYRNGDRISVFRPPRIEVDLTQEFPLVTTRRINWEFARDELLWFLTGSRSTKDASPIVRRVWDAWTAKHQQRLRHMHEDEGDHVGNSYGWAWRGWRDDGYPYENPDQLRHLVEWIRTRPNDAGHVVSLWSPADVVYQQDIGLIRPCHGTVIQCYVRGGRYLDLSTYQRSADVPVGLPYNLASYALLTHMIAQQTGYTPGRLIYELGDAHIYANQLGLVGDQLSRAPDPSPKLTLEHPGTFDGGRWPYERDHIHLSGYAPQEHIPYPVSV